MKLNIHTQYAIRFLVYLAQCRDDGRMEYISVNEIVAVTNTDLRVTSRLLNWMRRAKMLESMVGPAGGFRLRCQLDEITVYDLMLLMEQGVDISFAPKVRFQTVEQEEGKCAAVMRRLNDEVVQAFRSTTVAEFY